MRAADKGGGAYRTVYVNPEIGPGWLTRFFGEMDVVFTNDYRLAADGLARGNWAWALIAGGMVRDVLALKDQGLPVEEFAKPMKNEAGIISTADGISLVNRAPHPNAARLAINWFLSQEGQTVMHQKAAIATGVPSLVASLREDVTVFDSITPRSIRQKGKAYLNTNAPEFQAMSKEADEWMGKIWAERAARQASGR
jgi:ABC-type Fe3+ transport system substrate-binding protein